MFKAKYPQLLINPLERVNPKDPQSALKATLGGPLKLRWYRDEKYRRWEEAKELTARWKISQRLAQRVSDWLAFHGISAYVEFKAAGFRKDEEARASFDAFLTGKPVAPEPAPPQGNAPEVEA